MKKFLLYGLFLLSVPALAQTKALSVGQVSQMQGKYVFYYTKPVAAYDVAFTFTTPAMSACGVGAERADAVLRAALMEAGAQQKPFDAVLIGASDRDAAIRFRSRTAADSMALCRPYMAGGTAVYLLAEPVDSWTPAATQKTVWWDGMLTGQCFTGGQVIERSIRKLKGPKVLVIGDSNTYSAVPAKGE